MKKIKYIIFALIIIIVILIILLLNFSKKKDIEDDEDYVEDTERYLLDIKKGLNSIKKLFVDSNDFDHKAEEIVADMCEDFDCYGGNAEEYVYDTLKELGVDVHYEDIRTFYY